MEDLQALQKRLMEVQKSGGGFKLSERTVVDIIQKVLNRGKIKLVHTTNGKEYVAEEKITKEILDEIKRNQGRISKLDLIRILEIPSNILDSRINLLLTKDKTISLIEGKLITNYYLENMANEINDMLKVNGCVFIADLSTKFDLSIDFCKRFIRDKIGNSISAKLYATRLLTDEYVNNQQQKLRPILIGSIIPIQLSYIIDNYQIDELIIEDLVKNLINNGMAKGKLIANVFEPSIYPFSQSSYVIGVLNQNNYIEYSKLKNIGISKNAKEYIKDIEKQNKSLEDGVYLTDFYISNGLKNNFEYVFFDSLSKNYATNLNSVFLFEIYDEDVNILLDKINVKNNTIYTINTNLIPISFMDSFIENISPLLKEEASKQYNNFIAKIKDKKKQEPESSGKKVPKKGGKKGKNKNDEDDNEEESNENYINLTPQFKSALQNVLNKSPNLEDLHDKEETTTELFEKYAMVKINQLYSQYINEFIKSKSQVSTDPKNLMNQIENEFLELRLIQKTIENLMKLSTDANYQSAIKAIIAHICKKDLANLLKNVLTYQLIHMKSKIDLNKLTNPNDRRDIINTLPDEDLKEIFGNLNEHLQNKALINFMNYLQDNSKNIAISLSPLEKKKEKILIEKYAGELFKTIDEKFSLIGKTNKKEYISLTIDMCHNGLIKKGYYLKLPYEIWAIGIFINLFNENQLQMSDMKSLLPRINEILNLTEEEFFDKQNEISEYLKKLFNSY